MATDFSREFSVRLPQEICRVLEAQFQVYGRDEEEVIRDVLGEWARLKRNEAEFIVSFLKAIDASPRTGDDAPAPAVSKKRSG